DLGHLEEAELGAGIDAASVRALARVHRLGSTLDVSVEELVALWSALPRQAVLREVPSSSAGDGGGASGYPGPVSPLAPLTVPLFDRLFKTFVLPTGGPWIPAVRMFLHPALATAPPTRLDPDVQRLQAGTSADDDALYQLIVGLAIPLGIDPASTADA